MFHIYLFSVFYLTLCAAQEVKLSWPSLIDQQEETFTGDTEGELWHSNFYQSGIGNRFEMEVSDMKLSRTFPTYGVQKWFSFAQRKKIKLVGLSDVALVLYTKDMATDVEEFYQQGNLDSKPTAVSLFQSWNSTSRRMEDIAVIAFLGSGNKNSYLSWYKLTDNKWEALWDWSLRNEVTHLEYFSHDHGQKLLIVTKHRGRATADIYNFVIDPHFDIWLSNRNSLTGGSDTAIICKAANEIYLVVAEPDFDRVHLYRNLSSDGKVKSHQTIAIKELGEMTTFRIGFQTYLAIGGLNSVLYRFNGRHQLIEEQGLQLGHIINWLPVKIENYRQEVILLAENVDKDILVIHWNGEDGFKQQTTFSCHYMAQTLGISCEERSSTVSLQNAISINYKNTPGFLLPLQDGTSAWYHLVYHLKPVLSQVEKEIQELEREKQSILSRRAKQEELIETFKLQSTELLSNDTSNLITSHWKIRNLEADSIVTPEEPDLDNEDITTEDLDELIDLLNATALQLMKAIAKQKQLSDELYTEPLTKNIINGLTLSGKIITKDAYIEQINGFNVDKIYEDTVMIDSKEKISGIKTFASLEVDNLYFQSLNNLESSKLLFSDEKNLIVNGDLVFEDELQILEDVEVDKVGEIRPKYDLITPEKIIKENLKFEHIEVRNGVKLDTVNGIPMLDSMRQPSMDSLHQVQHPTVESIEVAGNMDVKSINGRDFKELIDKIIMKNENVELNQELLINGDIIAENLQIDSLNDIPFPIDYIRNTDNDIEIIGEKSFMGTLQTDHLQVKAVNKDRPEDWMTLSTNQTFDKPVTFKELHVLDKILVDDGGIVHDENPKNETHIFKSLIVKGTVQVNYLNNEKYSNVGSNVVYKDEDPVQIFSPKQFDSDINIENGLTVKTLNGFDPSEFLTTNTQQTLAQPVTFTGPVLIGNVTLQGLWDDINIKELSDSIVRLSTDDVINSQITFMTSPVFTTLELDSLATANRSLTEDNIYFINDTIRLDGDLAIKSLTAKFVHVKKDFHNSGKINKLDLRTLPDNLLSLSKPQTITAKFPSSGGTLYGNITFSRINGYSTDLMNKPTSDVDRLLEGKLKRIGTLKIEGNIKTKSGVNERNLKDMFDNAIPLDIEQIKGTLRFAHPLTFNELNIKGTINNVYLNELDDLVSRNDEVIKLRSYKTFVNGLNITGNAEVGYLNGRSVSDILTKHGDQTFAGNYEIVGNVKVRYDIPFEKINNISVTEITSKYSSKDDTFIMAENLDINNRVDIMNNLVVKGSIQRINFDEFLDDIIFNNEDVEITGDKYFYDTVKIHKNLNIKNKLNNLNLNDFYEDIILTNRKSQINKPIYIKFINLNNVDISNDLEAKTINSQNTKRWEEECIPLDTPIHIQGWKSFQHPIALGDVSFDFLNNHTTSQMIRLQSGPQSVPADLHFVEVISTSDVVVDGTVNGKVLQDELEDSVTFNGRQQHIEGEKDFLSGATVQGNIETTSVNKGVISDLLTTKTDQVIENEMTFDGNVRADDVTLEGLLNDINIGHWRDAAVLPNRDQAIEAKWQIFGSVRTPADVTGRGTINNVSLPQLLKEVEDKKENASRIEDEVREDYKSQCNDVNELAELAKNQVYVFKQFENIQGIGLTKNIENTIDLMINNENFLLISLFNDCKSRLYKWDHNVSQYIYQKRLNTGPITKWATTYAGPYTFLITSPSKRSPITCSPGNVGMIWRFNGSNMVQKFPADNIFLDIIVMKNTPRSFCTLDETSVYHWSIDLDFFDKIKIGSVSGDNYRFVPEELEFGLAITDGMTLTKLSLNGDNGPTISLQTIPGLHDGEILARQVNGNILTIVNRYNKQKTGNMIRVYDDVMRDELFDTISAVNPTSLTWIDFENGEQFLIFVVNNKVVEVHPYRGLNKFKESMKMYVPYCNKVQLVKLPTSEFTIPRYFLLLINKSNLYVLEVQMFGNPYNGEELSCLDSQ